MNTYKRLFISTFIVLTAINISAQTPETTPEPSMKIKAYRMSTARDFDTWDFGAHFGFTYASTDIAGSNIGFGGKQMSFGLDVTKFLTHSFAIQGRVLTGSLKGLDEDRPLFQYHTKINYDLSLNALFQIGNVSFLSRVPNLALYATIGVGVMKYSPYVSIDGGNTELDGIYSQYTQPYEYDNYKSSSDLVLPIGMGVKYRVSDKFTITGEYSVRNTKSDKLDGFFKLLSENDHYSTLNFGVAYHFGNSGKVLEWENPMQSIYNDYLQMKEKVDNSTLDSDEDGVADLFDKEPDTRIGSKVYGDGRSVDTDGDGIPDITDSDPYSNLKVKVEASGKEVGLNSKPAPGASTKDSDGDGIPDHLDAEPFSTRGAKVDITGKEIPAMTDERKKDSDGDGIADYLDSEPFSTRGAKVDVFGKEIKSDETQNTGTVAVPSSPPISEEEARKQTAKPAFIPTAQPTLYLPSIFFGPNQDVVESRYNNDLASVALAMYKNPELKLRIVGNCDTKGSITYNIALGNRRADAVKNYLVKKFKVDSSRLFTETVGKASTIDGAGSINRRVDLMVKE